MMRRLAVFSLVLTVAVLAPACGRSAPPPAEQAQPAASVQPAESTAAHMADHFTRVRELEEAILRGDIDAAKEPALWIADHQQATGLPAGTDSFVTEMRNAARAVAATESIGNAGVAAAKAVSTCGDCHLAAKVTPKMPDVGVPAALTGMAAQMRAHQYAVDLMYRGLVVPSEELWRSGAEALKTSPLTDRDLERVTPEIAAFEARVRELADRAAKAPDAGAKIAIYGEVISGCANCHALHGMIHGPGLPKK